MDSIRSCYKGGIDKLKEDKDNITVYSVVMHMIQRIEVLQKEGSQGTAILASIRNTVGKSFLDAENIWPFVFQNTPKEFLSVNGTPTKEENAIYIALQLYAISKQGTSDHVISDSSYKYSIGKSLSSGREEGDSKALDRRFNAMIASETIEELSWNLRQIVKVVKAKHTMKVNFPKLADDLFWFQKGFKRKICFRWATEYYSMSDDTISREEN